MFKLLVAKTTVALALVGTVYGAVPLYGQCGGDGYTGETTCVSGATCYFYNQWYSQCIPATSSPSSSSSSSSASSTSTTSTPTSTLKPNYWFSFGDSYTQTGFTLSSTLPSPSNPLGNPTYPGWTATGGANWIDFDTVTYNKSVVLTYNFAYGGATIDASLVVPYDPSVQSLTDQVNIFLGASGLGGSGTKVWTGTNALFSFWIGINDIGNSYYLSGDRAAFSDTLLNAYFALVQNAVGARNFLFINVPPVNRSPFMTAQGTSATEAERVVIEGFNSKLAAKVSAFKSANSGVSTWIWDSYASFTAILNNPTAYGFRDNTTYGDGTDIFWGNNYHPSTYAHKIFGQQIGTLLGNTVW